MLALLLGVIFFTPKIQIELPPLPSFEQVMAYVHPVQPDAPVENELFMLTAICEENADLC